MGSREGRRRQNKEHELIPLAALISKELKNEKMERPTVNYGCAAQSKKGEDYFLVKTDCQRVPGNSSSTFSVFAIFDGHNGNAAAVFTRENLLNHVLGAIPRGLGRDEWLHALPRALVSGFVKTDKEFQGRGETSGTTATFVIVDRWTVTVASVGDSRCILDTQGGTVSVLTVDHRLEENVEERNRVTASGGEVGRLSIVGGVEKLEVFYGMNPKGVGKSHLGVDQLSQGVASVNLRSSQDDDWEEVSKKNKRAGRSSARQLTPQNSSPSTWGKADTAQRPGIQGNNAPGKYMSQPPSVSGARNVAPLGVSPPLQHGWNWAATSASKQMKAVNDKREEAALDLEHGDTDDEEDNEEDDVHTEDDDILSDDFDSDGCEETHEMSKKHRLLRRFFEKWDQLTIQEINEPSWQWHCPACQGVPGAIKWYKGLQPLMTHAWTKGSKRVKLHRKFAELVEEELRRRGTSVVSVAESFGKWEGLKEEIKDHDIVWPPMVIIMNTILDKDDNDKWLGMGNRELLDYFPDYAAVKARHSYGPQGHRGMSVLIFESSCMGYLEAKRLDEHFIKQGTGREAWICKRALFYPGGKRQLYGYMALKKDIDEFNKHCQGKSKIKFEMKPYHDMVVKKMREMNEDNQQLTWCKNRVSKEQQHSKAVEGSLNIVTQKYSKMKGENQILRERTKLQHEQYKEEMNFQEQFLKEQIKIIQERTDEKEDLFEKIQREKRQKVEDSTTAPTSSIDESRGRAENLAKFVELQDKGMMEFVSEKEKLIERLERKKVEINKRYRQEVLDLEDEFGQHLTKLMEKYTPQH